MTAGLAHDFRNILAVVQSGVSVAKRAGPDSPNAELAWTAIDEAVRRGMRLTTELLVFARGGRPDVHTENVNDLLTGAITLMKYGAGPGIRVTLDLATTLPECRIDPAQFSAAILNLVVNARDAMPNGGEIRIATDECHEPCGDFAAPADRWVRVRISDQGSGMSADIVEHLFDPYFTTKGDAGTGLGVPQVVAFMRASGGSVCVSTEPGAGTCFDLRFPAADQGAQAGSQWRQLDRWVNEGGSQRPDQASPDERKVDQIAEPPRRSDVARKRKPAKVPIADRHASMPDQDCYLEALPSHVAPTFEPAAAAPAGRHAS
jgi:signal transduction histidine kinase